MLNSHQEISKLTVDTLDSFIARGGLFTIAAADGLWCDDELEGISLNLPGIVRRVPVFI